MLAQYSSSDSGAAVLGILIALALIGLQIYLIYAIIATRQDVRTIRGLLGGGNQGRQHSGGSFSWGRTSARTPHDVWGDEDDHGNVWYWCRGCDFTSRSEEEAEQHRLTGITFTASAQSSPEPTAASSTYKVCPDCVEEVRAAARKCRFCGHVFEDLQPL